MYKELTKANVKKQLARISQEVWTKGDILAFAKMLNSYKFSSVERKKQIMDLWSKLEEGASFLITAEQSQFGIDWLNKICFTSKGKNRQSKMVADFSERDFEVVKNFHHFELVGFHEASNGWGSCHYSPIYRTVGNDGKYFDYVARMWQAPEIVGRGNVKITTPLDRILA